MKRIGIFLDCKPYNGGSFQYNQSIIEALSVLPISKYQVVAIYSSENWRKYLNKYDFEMVKFRYSLWANIIAKLVGKFLKKLHKNVAEYRWIYSKFDILALQVDILGLDLVIAPGQEMLPALITTPTIATIHDLMHRYEDFPELYENGEYKNREYLYKNICIGAKRILVDSNVGKEHVIECYGAEYRDKIDVLPFTPPQYLFKNIGKKIETQKKFVFYPAQFWQHKNHKNLVLAVKKLKNEGISVHFLFVGSQKNGYKEIEKLIRINSLEENIEVKGYVSDNEMVWLYKHARAMIMPSFLGPTNIPPLEGMAMGCPVAVSDVYAMPEQIGNAGLKFNPRSVEDIANTIKKLWVDDSLCSDLVEKGYKQVEKFSQARFNEKLKEIIKAVL